MFKRGQLIAAVGAAALGVTGIAGNARAALVTLVNNNSTIKINTNHDANVDPTNQDGIYNWTVDGVTQLRQQEFFVRSGSSGGATAIGNLTQTASTATANFLQLTYQGSGFTVDVTYLLSGGVIGSKTSDIAETLKITNTSTATPSKTFSIIQYIDENLGGSGTNDTVLLTGGNTATQTSPNGYRAGTVVTLRLMKTKPATILAW